MPDLLFGLGLPATAGAGYDPVAKARTAESLGFDFLSTSDHPEGTAPTNEVWTLLTWVAARTERIRIATRVLGVPYRSPAMVAKMAETLDRLAGGRLILGLGGGASDDEFRAFGLSVPSPRDKVDGMADAIRIARGLWSTPEFSYAGRIYRTEAADLEPKPARPIPLWLGTYGPRALAVTGALADGWIPSLDLVPPERLSVLRERIDTAAAEAGRSPVDIRTIYNLVVSVGATSTCDRSTVAGPVTTVVERLQELLALGVTGFNLQLADPTNWDDQLRRLAAEVLPAISAS